MPSPAAAQHRRRRPTRTSRKLLAVTSLGLAGLLAGLLAGCGAGAVSSTGPNSYAQASGNWQFTSSAAAAARLSTLGGNLTIQGLAVVATLHPLSAVNQCLPTSTALTATGSIGAEDRLSLSAPVSGGTLTIAGTLAADRKSLSAATYTITGGNCAFPSTQGSFSPVLTPRDAGVPVTGQQYQPVSGTYTGTLVTTDGETFPLSTTLVQTSSPDTDGVYHVEGTAISPGNSCVPATLPATASAIDGGSISTTYTDAHTGATIIGTGNASPDAATITIAHWNINGLCGTASGTGVLTRQ